MAAAPMDRGSKPFEHKVSIVGMGSYEEAPSIEYRSIFVNTQLLIATDDNCKPPNANMAYTIPHDEFLRWTTKTSTNAPVWETPVDQCLFIMRIIDRIEYLGGGLPIHDGVLRGISQGLFIVTTLLTGSCRRLGIMKLSVQKKFKVKLRQ
jgi:hypothetical protein